MDGKARFSRSLIYESFEDLPCAILPFDDDGVLVCPGMELKVVNTPFPLWQGLRMLTVYEIEPELSHVQV